MKSSMIIEQRLTYPSGTCVAVIIKSLHTAGGGAEAAANGMVGLKAGMSGEIRFPLVI